MSRIDVKAVTPGRRRKGGNADIRDEPSPAADWSVGLGRRARSGCVAELALKRRVGSVSLAQP
jgi:hypothetical protein